MCSRELGGSATSAARKTFPGWPGTWVRSGIVTRESCVDAEVMMQLMGIATGRFEIQIEDVPQAVAVVRAQDAGVFAELAFEVPLRESRSQAMAEPQRFGVLRPRPARKWGSDARVPKPEATERDVDAFELRTGLSGGRSGVRAHNARRCNRGSK